MTKDSNCESSVIKRELSLVEIITIISAIVRNVWAEPINEQGHLAAADKV